MGRLRYSPAASADLEKIALEIIDNNGPLVAERNITRLRRSLENVGDFPRIGRKRPGLGHGMWSWPMPPWLAFYRIAGDDVEVIRIVFGGRRITRKMLGGQQT